MKFLITMQIINIIALGIVAKFMFDLANNYTIVWQ